MIESATFHVITTELVVGSFALAGLCFLFICGGDNIYLFSCFKTNRYEKINCVLVSCAYGICYDRYFLVQQARY